MLVGLSERGMESGVGIAVSGKRGQSIHVQGRGAGQEGGGEDEEAACELHFCLLKILLWQKGGFDKGM